MDRTFKAVDRHGNPVDFELKQPGLAEENEGERQYRIAYSKSLVEGVFPREKLREIMRDHGMWTEHDDSELKKAVGKIAILQIDLKNAEAEGNDKRCINAAEGIAEARHRMWELFLVQQSVYMNSAEGVAEMIKTEAIMAASTILKSTGQRYWADYAEYVRERDLNTKSTVYALVIEKQAKILDDARISLMEDYPEQQYLKSTQERMLDRELQEEVAKELHARAVAAIEADKAKEAPKKTPRKKATKKTTKKVAKRGKRKVEAKSTES